MSESKSTSRHDAFVSYSRMDKAVAEKLAGALKRFKPPRGIGLPTRRLDVFRDQEDLVGADYYESIEKALHGARKLILICSPDSAGSKYVNDEVERFLATRPAEDLVPVLVAGLPNNEAEERPSERAFPEALTQAVTLPLAIDYRGWGRSRRQGGSGALQQLLVQPLGETLRSGAGRDRATRRRAAPVRSTVVRSTKELIRRRT